MQDKKISKKTQSSTPLTAPQKIKLLFTIIERVKVDFYLDVLEGYEVTTYSIKINDSDKIDKPYYSISIVRQPREYVEFYLFVMKSSENRFETHDKIIKSFKQIKEFGYLWIK